MPGRKPGESDKEMHSRVFERAESGGAGLRQARISRLRRLYLDRPPVLYGLLMILVTGPVIVLCDSISPLDGLGRFETIGLLASTILAAALVDIFIRRSRKIREPLGVLPLLLFLALVVGIAAGEVSWRAAVATIVFGLLAVHFASLLSSALAEGEGTWIERHWGGLGGALTGWHASTPAVHLTAALGFGALLSIVLVTDTFLRSTEAQTEYRGEALSSAPATGVQDTPSAEKVGIGGKQAEERSAEPVSSGGVCKAPADGTADSEQPPAGGGR